jgi:hypothetical protein
VVANDRNAVLRFDHRHGGCLAQNINQRALVVRGQVPDQDERHAAIGRHFLKESLEGIKSAGRCAKADYQR